MAGVSFDVVANMDQAMTTVKNGVSKISDYVTSLSKNQVDWTDMLTGALDPAAIIGAITTLFSTAVLATGSFQAQLQNTSADSSNNFSNNMTDMGNAAIDMSAKTGASLDNATSALGTASTEFTDPSMANAVANFAATMSTAGGQFSDAGTDASDMSQVLKTFGITDVPTAEKAMNDMYTAAKNSGMSFSDFTSTIVAAGPSLVANKVSLQDSVDTLSALSTQSGMTAATAKSSFEAFANAINPANIALDAITKTTVPGIATALSTGDLPAAFTDLEKYLASGTQASQVMGTEILGSANNVTSLGNAGSTALPQLQAGVKTLTDLQSTFNGKLDVSLTDIGKLQNAWNTFTADYTKSLSPLGDGIIKIFADVLNDINTNWDSFWTKAAGYVLPVLTPVLDAINNQISSNLSDSLKQSNEALLNVVLGESQVRGTMGSVGNIGGLISATESNKDTNLMSSLIDALKTGNLGETNTVSSELNLNIGTINSNSKPQDIEQALYKALYNKFQSG